MKILFIHVSKNWNGRVYAEYPLGVGIMATIARMNGYDAIVHDMAVDYSSMADVLNRHKPDIIGLSFLSTSSKTAKTVINELRKIHTGPIIAGGIHSSIFPNEVVAQGVDVVVVGEGENKIIPLLHCLTTTTQGAARSMLLGRIPGLVFCDHEQKIQSSCFDSVSVDINLIPPVDRTVYDLSKYTHHSIITSRGCPYRCKFCCSWGPGGKKGRMASPERIITEIESLVREFNAKTIYWADDMFFFNKRDRLRFCNLLKERDFGIEWIAQLRADNLDSELVEALKTSGCVKICIGAETGDADLLKLIDKDLTREAIVRGIKNSVAGGLKVKTWWIVGLPGATGIKAHLSPLEIIEETKPHEVAVHNFIPLPGTIYWERAQDYGIHLPDQDSLEDLYYYGLPGDVHLDYLSKDELANIFYQYQHALKQLGYVPTDLATDNDKYVFTSPMQKRTFSI